MKLFLIRHGETVDNVAGLYAGVRDSALTNHGVEQARRLSVYFAKNSVRFTHIYSSTLTRAYKTADVIRTAQILKPDKGHSNDVGARKSLDVVQVPELIEQDFGYYEGKPFYARSESSKTGREAHYERHKYEPGFVDVESKECMGKRADAFLDEHLLPRFDNDNNGEDLVVAIVSHGILLSNLWRKLLLRLPRKSLTIAPEVVASRNNIILEHLGGWSNTGYLELDVVKDEVAHVLRTSETSVDEGRQAKTTTLPTPVSPAVDPHSAAVAVAVSSTKSNNGVSPGKQRSRMLLGWSSTILAIDSKTHLVGLKRQRGGIGRLAHDEGQKKLDAFFKRQKSS